MRLGHNLGSAPDGEKPMSDTGYKVQRLYFNRPGYKRTIINRCTLAEAQAHCSDPETSSNTARTPAAKRRTRTMGPWFDSYTER
jgi:hypothetical protein